MNRFITLIKKAGYQVELGDCEITNWDVVNVSNKQGVHLASVMFHLDEYKITYWNLYGKELADLIIYSQLPSPFKGLKASTQESSRALMRFSQCVGRLPISAELPIRKQTPETPYGRVHTRGFITPREYHELIHATRLEF